MATASAIASSSSDSAGTTRLKRPIRSPSSACTWRPVNAISAARPGPTSRGSVHDVPSSPTDRPILTNAALIFAFGDASRMSAASASAIPPPAAAPLMAAMTGTGSPRIPAMAPAASSWNLMNSRTPNVGRRSISSRSKPAQNALSPAPVMISARSSSSSRSSSGSAARSSNIWNDCEFIRSGRFSVATTMPGSGCESAIVARSIVEMSSTMRLLTRPGSGKGRRRARRTWR